MKCPKCGYIGFESAEKCRNCGYDFSLVADTLEDLDLPLRQDEPLAAPPDFDFATDDAPGPATPSPARPTDFDLPPPTPGGRELPLFTRPSAPPVPPATSAPPAAAPAAIRPDDPSPAPPAAMRPPAAPAPPAPGAPRASIAPAAPSPGATPAAAPPAAASSPAARPAASVPPVVPPPAPSSLPAAARPVTPAPAVSARPPAAPVRQAVTPARRVVPAAFDFKEAEPGLGEAAREQLASARTRPTAAVQAAGSVARAIAGLVDGVILLGLDAAVLYFTLRVCRLSFSDIAVLPVAPLVAFLLALNGGYLVAFTAVGGQTIGKMAASLKVIGEEGGRVEPSQAVVRAVGYLASLLPAGLGFVPGLFGPSRRALHDRLANTRVVRI